MLVQHGNAILFSLLEFWFINDVAAALDVLCIFQDNFLHKPIIIFFLKEKEERKKKKKKLLPNGPVTFIIEHET